MAKEYIWNVTVDGQGHMVRCVPTGNKYVIWVDDEELTVIYRLSNRKMVYGLEEKLEVCGKECFFIVWDERPDLVVDGQMVSGGKDYQQEKSKRSKLYIMLHWILFAMGVVLLGVVVVFTCLGWVDETERAKYCVYFGASVWLIVDSLIQRKRWKGLS